MARAGPKMTGLGSGCEGWTAVPTLLQRCFGKAEVVVSRSGAAKPRWHRLQNEQKTKGGPANVTGFFVRFFFFFFTFIEK